MSDDNLSTRAARLLDIERAMRADQHIHSRDVDWLFTGLRVALLSLEQTNANVEARADLLLQKNHELRQQLLAELTAAEARKETLEYELRGASDEIEWQAKRATAAEARLADVNVKDSVKTREINILTDEVHTLQHRLTAAEAERDRLKAVASEQGCFAAWEEATADAASYHQQLTALREALRQLVEVYTTDAAGHLDPEREPALIAAKAALSASAVPQEKP